LGINLLSIFLNEVDNCYLKWLEGANGKTANIRLH